MPDILQGAFDLHLHSEPDVMKRKLDDLTLAGRLKAAGMGGCLIKNHEVDTAPRAFLLQKLFPELLIRGGIALNRACGGLNPEAVACSGKLGGRVVWMPTFDARNFQIVRKNNPHPEGLLVLLDDNGKLKHEVLECLDAAAEYHMIAATGHVAPEEGLAMVREAHKRGIRTIITHADFFADPYSIEQQKEAVSLGAYIEHCYFMVYHKQTELSQVVNEIREVGWENSFLSTDFGQPNSPYPDEGIRMYAESMLEQGFTEKEVRWMTAELPRKILSNS